MRGIEATRFYTDKSFNAVLNGETVASPNVQDDAFHQTPSTNLFCTAGTRRFTVQEEHLENGEGLKQCRKSCFTSSQ